MRVFKMGILVAALGAAMTLTAACSSGSDAPKQEQEQGELGTLNLKLTGVSSTGATYKLSAGSFTVTGPKNVTLSSDTDPDANSIRTELPAGNYIIKLKAGWTLQKLVMGAYQPVKAVLVSDNPAGFTILDQGTTGVVFSFNAGDDVVQLGDGTLAVSIAVNDGTPCPMGTTSCNGMCVNLNADFNNCGACGVQCGPGQSCNSGVCGVSCPPGTASCGMGCVDIFNDPTNCGGCGIACSAGSACQMGVCIAGCAAGQIQCGGACVDPSADLQNCGACGNVCPMGFVCQAGACTSPGPLFQFMGVINDIPMSQLTGWSECYSDHYDNFSTPVAQIQMSCNQQKLLLGCRKVGTDVLHVAANASRDDVLFPCGQDASCSHVANGAEWYFDPNYSWGFARAGDVVQRNSCDVGAGDDNGRLCWHTGNGGNINGGYRCGENTGLNNDPNWERVILQAP